MNTKKSNLFISELSNLFFFWFIAILFFSLFRLTFLLFFNEDINGGLPFLEYLNAFFMGFRFDTTVVSYFLILPFLTTFILIPLKYYKTAIFIRKLFQVLFGVLASFVCVITINYYKEYQDQFNHFLFMGLYDDQKAILQSIIADFHPITNTIIIGLLGYVLIKIFNYFEHKKNIFNFLNSLKLKHKKIFIGSFAFALFIGSIRGSYTEYPVRRFYAAVTSDDFVNKIIINPFRSLNNAISDYNDINKSDDKNPFGELPDTIKNNFSLIQETIKKETDSTSAKIKPKQIFLVVMESYDSWPLMEEYKDLNISSNLQKIKNKGVSFTNFLPAANSTMNSLGAIITGVPYCGVNISNIGSQRSFPGSIFKQFKNLGYETNFFFTVYSSWQNLGNFSKKQGVDNVYDGTSSKAPKGIWGINDENLFKNVISKVDTTKNSLNIILTMSYHTPYEEDVYAKGFTYKTIDDLPKKYREIYNEDKMPFNVLGHLWYADKTLGEFVEKAENKYSNSLFAFTGDHFGRRFINGNPTLYQTSSVPFILYGKNLPTNEIRTNPGSHIDITPTLIDLITTKKEPFYGFGNSLLNKNNNQNIGIGYNKTITKSQLFEYTKNYGTKKLFFNKSESKTEGNLKKEHDSLMSLAWHYTVKGDSIK